MSGHEISPLQGSALGVWLPSQTVEKDPHGKDPHQPGAKLDLGKNRLGLVLLGFSRALQAVGEVGTYGANKYSDNGWVDVPDGQRRYTDAMLRHLLCESAGEPSDPDTGLHHAAHAAWNALARLDLLLRAQERDRGDGMSAKRQSKAQG